MTNDIKFPNRVKNLRNYLYENNIDAIIISNEINRFYFFLIIEITSDSFISVFFFISSNEILSFQAIPMTSSILYFII